MHKLHELPPTNNVNDTTGARPTQGRPAESPADKDVVAPIVTCRVIDDAESLIPDPRGQLRPADAVEQKLLALLRRSMIPLSQVRATSLPRGRGLG